MDPNNMGNEDVAQVFELIQDSSACHLKYAITLKRALETYNDEFLEEFIRCMHATLLADYSGKNVYVERCSNLAIESCRYWSCKLINRILEKVEEVNDDLYEQVREAMLERLKVRQLITEKIAVTKDSLPLIVNRVRDVDANVRLTAFQKLCPLVKFLKVSQRRLIIQCGFLDSSQKVKSFVSTQLLESWLKTYNNNYLQLMESIRLDACEEDIKKTTALVEFILNASFKSKSVQDIVCNIKLNPQKLIEYENLNWESVLYYRIVTQFFRRSEEFEEVLYCDFVNGKLRFDMLEYYFILQQFFLITQEYDLSDTASRKCLNSLAHHMLQNIELTADVAECVMQNLEKTILSTEDLSIFVCEIISNIMYGDDDIDYEALHQEETKRQQSISQLKADISELREKEDQCIFEKRFLDAQQIKCDIEKKQAELESVEMVQIKTEPTERKTDVPTIVKYLTVAEGLLRLPSIKRLNPALATLCSEVIQKVIPHESDEVKAKAFKCYGLCCVIDKKCASYGIHIFSAPIFSSRTLEDCDSEILSTCIKVVVDLLCIYGLSLVDKTEESELSDSRKEDEKKVFVGGTSLADLIGGLADLLEHE
ncbi:condensin complex subunit 3-like, partial [Asbolus verrucosus]